MQTREWYGYARYNISARLFSEPFRTSNMFYVPCNGCNIPSLVQACMHFVLVSNTGVASIRYISGKNSNKRKMG